MALMCVCVSCRTKNDVEKLEFRAHKPQNSSQNARFYELVEETIDESGQCFESLSSSSSLVVSVAFW